MTKRLLAAVVVFMLCPFSAGVFLDHFVLPRIVDYFHHKPNTCAGTLAANTSCTLALKDLPPSVISAGPFQWNVRFVKTGDEFGEIVYRPLELRVGEDLPPDQIKETVLHELFHACLFVGGGGTSGPVIHGDQMTDDQFIEAAAPTMIQVLRDNPELVAWLARR